MTAADDVPDVPDVLLAGVPQRAVAKLIDTVVVALLVAPFVFTTMRRIVENPDRKTVVPLWAVALAAGFSLVYEWAFVAWRGQPIGAMVMRVKVVAVDGGPVGFSHAGIRALVPAAVQLVPYGIGAFLTVVVYAWAFIDPHKQGLHDKAAGTLVIQKLQ